jgi:uncharacterized short protein YbdD (DUF466 family)
VQQLGGAVPGYAAEQHVSLKQAIITLRGAWRLIRQATGDDAYERYLEHQALAHPGQSAMTRSAFYNDRQRRKWSGVSRCC